MRARPPGIRPRVGIPPPLLFVPAIVLGQILGGRVPIPMPLDPHASNTLGVLTGAIAIGLIALAVCAMAQTGQQPAPLKPTPELITTGLFRISRNPIYLAFGLGQAALGCFSLNPWPVILTPVSLGLVYLAAVRPEEAYLERAFGNNYRRYRQRVRRWI